MIITQKISCFNIQEKKNNFTVTHSYKHNRETLYRKTPPLEQKKNRIYIPILYIPFKL